MTSGYNVRTVTDTQTDFETHLTIAAPTTEMVERLRGWAGRRSLKFTHIELSHGLTPSQPMVTAHARSTLPGALSAGAAFTAELSEAGFAVVRTKLEVSADDLLAPRTAGEAGDRERYFEAHVKLLLPDDAAVAAVAEVADQHDCRVSRNGRRSRPDGRHERFVTHRGHAIGVATARRQVDALLSDLTARRFEVLDVEREFVVYDSNVHVDAGWM